MSRFFSTKYNGLTPYTPGEQPKIDNLIKLNTNESPYPPSEKAFEEGKKAMNKLNLYSDPECKILHEKLSEILGVKSSQVLCTNGSDEILNFAFMAFCDKDHPIVFPDITYGFYPVFAELNNIPYEEIPLKDDFSIDPEDYIGINKNIVIANPNAPTGMCMPLSDIERIVKSNPDNIVIIDEAYVDFGGESAVCLIDKYDNLLVTQTFSKSRSFAGARLGFGVACDSIINDLNTIKYSTNPYNINMMTMFAGYGVLCDEEYTKKNIREIINTREYTVNELKDLGFSVLDSKTNFIFAKHCEKSGEYVYGKLREAGILVRHFDKDRIMDYNRITIGTMEDMKQMITVLKNII
ncbi:MAG: histidinol-phosphate transaminase [Ruminococcaceae bacterium]|nr:histidinol-phosphate transaminase [Oscillospiraceae bacterium]